MGLVGGARSKGVGLLGIEERVREIGGVVTIESLAGRGTTVSIDIPLPRAALGAAS